MLPKLFGPLAARYANRPGGYTRVLHIEPIKEDQAPSAILELVDGPADMRWNITARTMAREQRENLPRTDLTRQNIAKVTKFRENGMEELETLAHRLALVEEGDVRVPPKRRVYPEYGKEPPKKARHTV